MAEYKVTRVSTEKPREHYNEQYKSTTYYIKVMFEGHIKPVSVGKRSPAAIKPGDVLYGEIIPTDYDTDNFKFDPKTNSSFAPKDQNAIRAQWAIGQAKDLYLGLYSVSETKPSYEEWIEGKSVWFYKMVDNIKHSAPPSTPGYDMAKAVRQTFSDGSPVDNVIENIGDGPIDLDSIPF